MMKSVLTLVAPPDRQPLSDAVTTVLLQRLYQLGATTGDIAWLQEGIACDIPFDNLPVDQTQQLVTATLAELPIDFHVQPAANRRKKLLLSDMDSTILTNETLDDIADIAGLKDEIAAITARTMAGELDFTQALIERIAMLAELSETALTKAFERIDYSAGGATLVATMRQHGAYTALVSGGFKYFTKRVAAKIGFDLDLANDLEISDGRLTGRLQGPILDPDGKLSALIRLSDEHGLTPADAATVGDGSNDIPMLRAAGLGVAYRGKPIVRQAIGCQVNYTDLTALLYFQGYQRTEFVVAEDFA
jgi:phosphoserine phosphatase